MSRSESSLGGVRLTGAALVAVRLWRLRRAKRLAFARSAATPLFVESAAATGLDFTHVNGATGQYYMPEMMGAGVALFDYDNDGDLDVFLVQGGALDAASDRERGTGPTAACFATISRSVADGRRTLRFTDVTDRAGVALRGYGMGAAVGDYDNDGYLDLFVTSFGPETLFHNNGDGTFTDVTARGGRQRSAVEHERRVRRLRPRRRPRPLRRATTSTSRSPATSCATTPSARATTAVPRAYRPVPDRLYRNEGNGRFTDVTDAAGISKADGAGLGVATGDYNGDGWLDLYVANDATPNQLWINRHDGTFVDEGLLSGAALNAAGNPEGSMGIASGDFDRDGDEDLFVTNIVGETFALYVNDGHGNFEDARVASRAGGADRGVHRVRHRLVRLRQRRLARSLRRQRRRQHRRVAARPAAPVPDEESAVPQRRQRTLRGDQRAPAGRRSRARRSAAAPRSATSTTTATSTSSSRTTAARSAAAQPADRQESLAAVRLEQRPANRFAFGAWVGVERAGHAARSGGGCGPTAAICRRATCARHFGLGASAAVTGVVVQWPDGLRERWTDVAADRVVTLQRGTGSSDAAR